MITAATFEACYAALPDARVTIRAGRATVARALCGGVVQVPGNSEQGVYMTAGYDVSMLAADDPGSDLLASGARVTLAPVSGPAVAGRVAGRNMIGEVLQITITGEAE